LLFGRFTAEEALSIDGSTIYKWLKKMEQLEMITLNSSSHYTVLTINNYNDYNDTNGDKVAATELPLNSHVTTIEQPRNTYNKDNKVIKVKKVKEINARAFQKKLDEFKTHYRQQWSIITERGKAEKAKGFPDPELKYKLEKALRFFTDIPKYIQDNELNMILCMRGQFKAENMIDNQELYDIERIKGLLMRIEESEAVKSRSNPHLSRTVLNWIKMGVN
jgi:hypothetical protein